MEGGRDRKLVNIKMKGKSTLTCILPKLLCQSVEDTSERTACLCLPNPCLSDLLEGVYEVTRYTL
jgi:hypothetical protein